MALSNDIAMRLRQIRAESTQTAFASRLGIDVSTVKRWEAGSLVPNGSSLLNLARCYGIDANWLLTGKGAPPEVSFSTSERQILYALRNKGEGATREVFELLGLPRYLIERQDHDGEWHTLDNTDNLDEARAKAGIGFRRVIDLYTGRIALSGAESGLG